MSERYLDWCCYNCDNLQWADDPPQDGDKRLWADVRRECSTCNEMTWQFAAVVLGD